MKGISPAIDFSFDFQDLDLQRIIARTKLKCNVLPRLGKDDFC